MLSTTDMGILWIYYNWHTKYITNDTCSLYGTQIYHRWQIFTATYMGAFLITHIDCNINEFVMNGKLYHSKTDMGILWLTHVQQNWHEYIMKDTYSLHPTWVYCEWYMFTTTERSALWMTQVSNSVIVSACLYVYGW